MVRAPGVGVRVKMWSRTAWVVVAITSAGVGGAAGPALGEVTVD